MASAKKLIKQTKRFLRSMEDAVELIKSSNCSADVQTVLDCLIYVDNDEDGTCFCGCGLCGLADCVEIYSIDLINFEENIPYLMESEGKTSWTHEDILRTLQETLEYATWHINQFLPKATK